MFLALLALAAAYFLGGIITWVFLMFKVSPTWDDTFNMVIDVAYTVLLWPMFLVACFIGDDS